MSEHNCSVLFRFDLGGGPAILRSRNVVEPGRSHRVVARRMQASGILIVDNDPDVMGSGPNTHISLDLNDPLFLGFIPKVSQEWVSVLHSHQWLCGWNL